MEEKPLNKSDEKQGSLSEGVRGVLDPRLVLIHDKTAVHSEQYRVVRTNILSLNRERPPRCLALTSAIRREGKSITTLNLSMCFAEDPASQILVVDADLRKPMLNRLFKKKRVPGISDVLLGKASLEEVLQPTEIKNLRFIGAGTPVSNPVKVLASDRLASLMEILKEDYHFIFVDTPPVTGMSDLATLGKVVDGVILVVKIGAVGRKLITDAMEAMRKANVKVVGSVLTNVVRPPKEYAKYYSGAGTSK